MGGCTAFLLRCLLLAVILGMGWLITNITGESVFIFIAIIIDIILLFVLMINHG